MMNDDRHRSTCWRRCRRASSAIVRAHARATPDAPALQEDSAHWSYAELAAARRRLRRLLRALKLQARRAPDGGRRELRRAGDVRLLAIASLDAWVVHVNARL
jgi:long-chain acyl-CoA synthetase